MLRQIIKIDKEKCDGCGLCVSTCHEGAIGIVDGKAELLRDDYCDGLGNCLPACPTGAITFEVREALEFNENEVKMNVAQQEDLPCGCPGTNTKTINREPEPEDLPCGCPGTNTKTINREPEPEDLPCGCPGTNTKTINREPEPEDLPCGCPGTNTKTINREPGAPSATAAVASAATAAGASAAAGVDAPAGATATATAVAAASHLNQWPVQIKLVPVNAPFFKDANLLIAADCAAYAYGDFHRKFMQNKITLIGCPKLDDTDYSEKLTAIIRGNNIKSVTIVRMEVPCCGGIEQAVITALRNSGKMIPWQCITITTEGKILDI